MLTADRRWGPDGRPPVIFPAEYLARYPDFKVLRTLDGGSAQLSIPWLLRGTWNADRRWFAGLYNDGWGTVERRLYRCREYRVDPPPHGDTETLFYPQSRIEPWSAAPLGEPPEGWRDRALSDIRSAGLHPISLELARSTVPEASVRA